MKNLLAAHALLLAAVFAMLACNRSQEVQIGPQTNSQIQQGEEAQKKLSRQNQLDSEVTKLEDELESWIQKASTASAKDDRFATVTQIIFAENRCTLIISDEKVTIAKVSYAIEQRQIEKALCEKIVVVATHLSIEATETLSSSGRNLIIIADVIDLDGTISTEGLPVGSNENGKPGGDLNIYTLVLNKGPSGRLVTKGSNAGAFREVERTGVSFTQSVASIKKVDVNAPVSQNLGHAFSAAEAHAQDYLSQVHPRFGGKAPNPFREATRLLKIEGQTYFWKIGEEKIELTPVANDRMSIRVKQIEEEYFREGGKAGSLVVRIASRAPLETPQLKIHSGTDAIESSNEYSEWMTSALEDSISVRHKNLVRYTFELYFLSKTQPETLLKAWSITKSQTAETEEVMPRKKLQTRILDWKTAPIVPTLTRSFVFEPGDSSFIDELQKISGLDINSLPEGLKNLKAWHKDWTDLESRAKQLGLKVKRKN